MITPAYKYQAAWKAGLNLFDVQHGEPSWAGSEEETNLYEELIRIYEDFNQFQNGNITRSSK